MSVQIGVLSKTDGKRYASTNSAISPICFLAAAYVLSPVDIKFIEKQVEAAG